MVKRYGWGDCSRCGMDVRTTKHGKAARHGFIRIKKGFVRKIDPTLASGHDHHACPGSGKPVDNWYKHEYDTEASAKREV